MPELAAARILLIDDDEDEFLIVRDFFEELERGRFVLDWASSLEKGLHLIREARHDVVLCDYHLGPRTGLELLREAKAVGARMPIIILTGQGDRSVDMEVMQAGAEDYLDKGDLTASLLERSVRYAIERRRTAEHVAMLKRVEAELQAAVALRDEFLTIASHELKTPLTPLQLQLDGLRRALKKLHGIPPDEHVRFERRVEMACKQLRRLNTLVENLLDVSRIAGGRLELRLEPTDLGDLARDVVERFRPESEAAGCDLRVEASHVVGLWDRFRIEQVLSNLVSNAIKYGRGAPIVVSASATDGSARLSVSDRGIGIEPEEQRRIFGRFERAVPSRHYGGLGLGLYIVRQIVEAHGGSIVVHSEPGKGSTFTVLLPVHAGARPSHQESAQAG